MIKKSIFNKLSKILILILIGLFIWFCSFNIKNINKGRELTFESVVNNSYEAENKSFYLEFINNELLFYSIIYNYPNMYFKVITIY